mmetsp:Transcript_30765/g.86347  ORF Transcript_30765/g.86347 Transcript_30765/m.86347 type:complete len:215 (-) Transcript_30765:8-652(-)
MSLMSRTWSFAAIFALILSTCSSVSFVAENTVTGSMDSWWYRCDTYSSQIALSCLMRLFLARNVTNLGNTVDSHGPMTLTMAAACPVKLMAGSLSAAVNSNFMSPSIDSESFLYLITSFVTTTLSLDFAAASMSAFMYTTKGPLGYPPPAVFSAARMATRPARDDLPSPGDTKACESKFHAPTAARQAAARRSGAMAAEGSGRGLRAGQVGPRA